MDFNYFTYFQALEGKRKGLKTKHDRQSGQY